MARPFQRGSRGTVDRALARDLQERFGDRLLAPVRQRHDETEIRVSLADAVDTLRVLHDDPAFDFEMLIDLCGVDTEIGRAHV